MEEKLTPQGFILLHRSILKSFYYKDSEHVHLWLHLLLKANWKEKSILYKGKRFPIKRGQFVTSRKSIVKETGINRSKVERILKTFESEQQIEQQNYYAFRLITILNYNEYQDVSSKLSSKRAASEQPVSTTKEEEQLKRSLKTHVLTSKTQLDQWLKEENRCLTSGWIWHQEYETFQLAIDLDDAYEAWWNVYPRHEGKKPAKEHFRARCKDGLFDEICEGAYGYGQYIKQQLSNRGMSLEEYEGYIKHPKTFLQKDCWKEKIGYKYYAKL